MNIHTGLLEGLSAPLYAMISNGCMKESRDGTAVLEDVEPAVFAAFCEFAYIGTYTIPGRPVTSTTKALGNKDTADTRQVGHTEYSNYMPLREIALAEKKTRSRRTRVHATSNGIQLSNDSEAQQEVFPRFKYAPATFVSKLS